MEGLLLVFFLSLLGYFIFFLIIRGAINSSIIYTLVRRVSSHKNQTQTEMVSLRQELTEMKQLLAEQNQLMKEILQQKQ